MFFLMIPYYSTYFTPVNVSGSVFLTVSRSCLPDKIVTGWWDLQCIFPKDCMIVVIGSLSLRRRKQTADTAGSIKSSGSLLLPQRWEVQQEPLQHTETKHIRWPIRMRRKFWYRGVVVPSHLSNERFFHGWNIVPPTPKPHLFDFKNRMRPINTLSHSTINSAIHRCITSKFCQNVFIQQMGKEYGRWNL